MEMNKWSKERLLRFLLGVNLLGREPNITLPSPPKNDGQEVKSKRTQAIVIEERD